MFGPKKKGATATRHKSEPFARRVPTTPPSTPQNASSTHSHLEVLDAEVAPAHASLDPGYIFMQDNAAIHIAHKIHNWFSDRRIVRITDWPPYSPDFNPIEHIW